jgi:PAS domain S-box-containing protein
MHTHLNFQSLFQETPGLHLVLLPDLSIVAASNAYLEATLTKLDEILGRHLFDVFPDNPDDTTATGVSNLRASLEYVLLHKEAHAMAIQKYDVRRPDGSFEERFWSPLNKPVLNAANEVLYIIHNVTDVTLQQDSENKKKTTELLLRSSIESLKDMIILSIDREYRYLVFNTAHKKATYQAYGIEIKPGMNLLDHLTNEKDREQARKNFDRTLAGEWHTTIEEYGTLERSYFETRYNPIIDEHNKVIGATAFAINVTDRKNAENELLNTNRFLDTILENIPNMLFVKDAEHLRFLSMNKAGEQLLGYLRNDLIGKNDYDFFPSAQADFFTQKDREVLLNGALVDIPEEKIATTYGEKWLHTKKIPVTDRHGKPIYLLGISEDITAKKKVEEEIVQINARLAEAYKELEAFSYSVSHDLKAPLRSLQGFSKALQENYKEQFDSEAQRWLQFIESNANRMGILIDDILNFSKVSRADLKLSEVNMWNLAHEVYELEKHQYPQKKIQLDIADIPVAWGDPAMLWLVWQNLISNALKYSSKKKIIRITIQSTVENGFNIYSVTDNGAGFDKKYKDKMFGVFQRLHSNDEFDGTGVGLAIVSKILQKHNGWINASSEPGKGARFNFAIPIKNQ